MPDSVGERAQGWEWGWGYNGRGEAPTLGAAAQAHRALVRATKSVHFSRSVMSDSLRPHGLQHTRPPCPSPTPVVYPNSCSLSQ